MKRILVVEDEPTIREFVVIALKKAGYEVFEASSGETALEIFSQNDGRFQIALLDIMLPGIDGLEVCRRLRSVNQCIGIIMLTARTQESDKIEGLTVGADDYITKPFSPSELIARVESLYRRININEAGSREHTSDSITQGEFCLNLRRRSLEKSAKEIELTQVEFQIMEYFFSNPEKQLSRTDILRRVWGDAYFGEEKIVDVNIRRLRIKIENEPSNPRHIVTVWGMGYKWQV